MTGKQHHVAAGKALDGASSLSPADMTLWSESRSVLSDSLGPHGLYSPWNSPGQNTGEGCHTPITTISKILSSHKQKFSTYQSVISHFPFSSALQFSSVQSLSRVWLFATPWIKARQAFLSITNSQSLLKLMSPCSQDRGPGSIPG